VTDRPEADRRVLTVERALRDARLTAIELGIEERRPPYCVSDIARDLVPDFELVASDELPGKVRGIVDPRRGALFFDCALDPAWQRVTIAECIGSVRLDGDMHNRHSWRAWAAELLCPGKRIADLLPGLEPPLDAAGKLRWQSTLAHVCRQHVVPREIVLFRAKLGLP